MNKELLTNNTLLNAFRRKNENGELKDENGNVIAVILRNTEMASYEVPELEHLVYLNLSDNKNLTEVTFSKSLPKLRHFDISDSKVKSIFLPGFQNLEWLDISRNGLEEIEIKKNLPSLEYLDLSGNEFKKIELPSGFESLKYLYLNQNKLTQPKFPFLINLEILSLKDNQLQDFKLGTLNLFPNLETLYLQENPLNSKLNGFANKTGYGSCLEDFKNTFQDETGGTEKDTECKILFIGNGNVGKSCAVRRMKYGKFDENWNSTHGISLEQWEHEGYMLNLWDFGGQDIYHSTHRLFMQSDAVYLVLWDLENETKPHSPNIEECGVTRNYRNHRLPYWLHYAKVLGKNSPIICVQTKTERDAEQDPPNVIKGKISFRAVESSIDDWDENGYNELMVRIRTSVRKVKSFMEVAENWLELRAWIRKKQENGEKSLSFDSFIQKAEELKITDPTGILQYWLHKNGVVFYSPRRLNNEIILDQSWAIEAIYSLFDRTRGGQLNYHYFKTEKKGRFTGKDLLSIWNPKYDDHTCRLFLDFMLSCEIAFEITPKDEKKHWVEFEKREFIAPQLLPEEKPEGLEDFWDERLAWHLNYSHDFLHFGVIQTFIVRTRELAELPLLWINGTRLKTKDNQYALVEADEQNLKIRITRKSVGLLNKIRNLIEEIQDSPGRLTVSSDGVNFVEISKLKNHDSKISIIHCENGKYLDFEIFKPFLERDEKAVFEKIDFEKNIKPIPMRSKADEVRDLVAKNRLVDALEKLKQYLPKYRQNEAILLQGRLAEAKKSSTLGIVSSGEGNMTQNQIRYAILELANAIEGDNSGNGGVKNLTKPIPPKPSPGSVYISYAWGNESGEIAVKISEELAKRGVQVIIDVKNLGYGESIKSFMEDLGKANKIITVISKKYLESDNCMFELTEIYDNEDFAKRIFPIVLSDANIYRPIGRIGYIKFWDDKIKELDAALKSVDVGANLTEIQTELNNYVKIRGLFDKLAAVLKDLNALNPEIHQNENFESLYKALTNE